LSIFELVIEYLEHLCNRNFSSHSEQISPQTYQFNTAQELLSL